MHVWKHCDQDVTEKGEREGEGRREEQNKFTKKKGGGVLGERHVGDENGKKGRDWWSVPERG